ncbi:MAG TPA: VOC family protein [Gemmataceae bacterium]|nr:VOC family protein [Gemmataceae bacterium]
MADNRVVHFEIPADDPAKLAEFYTKLFGWKIEKIPVPNHDYWGCKTGEGMGIDGGIMKRVNPQQTVTNYTNVEQLDATLAQAKQLGAQVALGKTPVAGMGWIAVAIDPQGNLFGLWQSDPGAK